RRSWPDGRGRRPLARDRLTMSRGALTTLPNLCNKTIHMRMIAAPPTDPVEALGWVRNALDTGLLIIDGHYYKRCQERRISPRAYRRVIHTARSCIVYAPKNGP